MRGVSLCPPTHAFLVPTWSAGKALLPLHPVRPSPWVGFPKASFFWPLLSPKEQVWGGMPDLGALGLGGREDRE